LLVVDGACDATPYYAAGAKIGIDATRKTAGEGQVRDWPDELEMSEQVKQLVNRRWREYGL